MTPIETLTGERLHVNHHGHEALSLAVTDPRFGRVARVKMDHEAAVELAATLTGLLMDRGHVPTAERKDPG